MTALVLFVQMASGARKDKIQRENLPGDMDVCISKKREELKRMKSIKEWTAKYFGLSKLLFPADQFAQLYKAKKERGFRVSEKNDRTIIEIDDKQHFFYFILSLKQVKDYLFSLEPRQNEGIKVKILRAFFKNPRKDFVPALLSTEETYRNGALHLELEKGVSIPQEIVIAAMLYYLHPKEGDTILEIGTGSFRQTALLANLAGRNGKVVSMDIHEDWLEKARNKSAELGAANTEFVHGDGIAGYPDSGPFDGIIYGGAARTQDFLFIKATLSKQLKTGGRLIIPVGAERMQEVEVYRKDEAGNLIQEKIFFYASFFMLRLSALYTQTKNLTAHLDAREEKIRKAACFVKEKISYGFTDWDVSADEVLDKRTGMCAGKSLLLFKMFQILGIDARYKVLQAVTNKKFWEVMFQQSPQLEQSIKGLIPFTYEHTLIEYSLDEGKTWVPLDVTFDTVLEEAFKKIGLDNLTGEIVNERLIFNKEKEIRDWLKTRQKERNIHDDREAILKMLNNALRQLRGAKTSSPVVQRKSLSRSERAMEGELKTVKVNESASPLKIRVKKRHRRRSRYSGWSIRTMAATWRYRVPISYNDQDGFWVIGDGVRERKDGAEEKVHYEASLDPSLWFWRGVRVKKVSVERYSDSGFPGGKITENWPGGSVNYFKGIISLTGLEHEMPYDTQSRDTEMTLPFGKIRYFNPGHTYPFDTLPIDTGTLKVKEQSIRVNKGKVEIRDQTCPNYDIVSDGNTISRFDF